MRNIRKLLLGLLALALFVSTGAGVAYAHDGEDHRKTDSHSSTPADQKSRDGSSAVRPDADKAARASEDTLRRSGDDLLKRLRSEQKTQRTPEQRKQNCENRKHGLQTKLNRLSENGLKHQKRIDDVLAKVIAYQKDRNLVIENFEALVAAANSAQATSKASVQALTALKPTIDCAKDSVPNDVAAFKEAAAQARNDLTAYKKAVKDVLKATESAKSQEAR